MTNYGNSICHTEYFIHDFNEISRLVVVDEDEDGAVLRQEVTRQEKARVDHRAPIRMETPVRRQVLHQPAAILGEIPALRRILRRRPREIITVHEIMPRVIRRIDVNHLHPPRIRLTQQLQRIQVVALAVHVPRRTPVHRTARARAQHLVHRRARQQLRRTLARPRELITLTTSTPPARYGLKSSLSASKSTERTTRPSSSALSDTTSGNSSESLPAFTCAKSGVLTSTLSIG